MYGREGILRQGELELTRNLIMENNSHYQNKRKICSNEAHIVMVAFSFSTQVAILGRTLSNVPNDYIVESLFRVESF